MNKFLIAISFLFLVSCAGAGVIGVGYNKTGTVKYVFKGSPAEKAGLKIGDVILNTKQLRGTVGTQVLVKFTRDGVLHEIAIKRQDIGNLNYEAYESF